MRVSTTLVLFTLLLAGEASAAIIRVPQDQPTIQAGINAAVNGDSVLVAAGTYRGAGNRDISFGGREITVVSEGGPEVTIIDCEGNYLYPHRGFAFLNNEPAESRLIGFRIEGGYGASDAPPGISAGGAILVAGSAGPTIRGCEFVRNQSGIAGGALYVHGSAPVFHGCRIDSNYVGASSGENHGGGATCQSGANASFYNCTFAYNRAPGFGGALSVRFSSPTIQECVFRANTGATPNYITGAAIDYQGGGINIRSCEFIGNKSAPGYGGAIDARSASGEMAFCLFDSNSVTRDGGAVHLTNCSPSITSCWFTNNVADLAGALFCDTNAAPTISDCIFARNRAVVTSAVRCQTNASPRIVRSTFFGNAASYGNGVIGAAYWSYPSIEKCIVAFNERGGIWCAEGGSPTVSCSNVFDEGGCGFAIGVNGNFSADPRFCEASTGNLYLAPNSPCLDVSGCGLIGVLPQGCEGQTSVEVMLESPATWGSIKHRFESGE